MKLNKLVATIAATSLLLIGGGTYALWTATATTPEINLTTGKMSIEWLSTNCYLYTNNNLTDWNRKENTNPVGITTTRWSRLIQADTNFINTGNANSAYFTPLTSRINGHPNANEPITLELYPGDKIACRSTYHYEVEGTTLIWKITPTHLTPEFDTDQIIYQNLGYGLRNKDNSTYDWWALLGASATRFLVNLENHTGPEEDYTDHIFTLEALDNLPMSQTIQLPPQNGTITIEQIARNYN